MAYRARKAAKNVVLGDQKAQYTRIRDYLQAVLDTNPGSRCIVTTKYIREHPSKNPRFHGLFICLNGCKEGFLNGCRPFIGLDGCFIKLTTGQQILAATGRDGNNNIFPIAFGIVDKENTDSWTWFLYQLRVAIGGQSGQFGQYTIISDRQKGLLKAINRVFPSCPQRWVLDVRAKPIRTMVDGIRTKLMVKFNANRTKTDTVKWEICPTYAEKLEEAKKWSRNCQSLMAGPHLYQVTSGEKTYVVNLQEKSCGCRKWDMTEVPCHHAVSAIHKATLQPARRTPSPATAPAPARRASSSATAPSTRSATTAAKGKAPATRASTAAKGARAAFLPPRPNSGS
ncbi:uncharacterized protein [Aegilops tauschii subsp. strangulata]|uniref:uncharacterized protein n=1 Tax=Aegilops tauschii subsp. strangulata TaxID=200361 RepID=UPI003CC89558